MILFDRRKKQKEQVASAEPVLAEARKGIEDLDARVRRLERESEVFMLQRKRELRSKGVTC